MDEYMHCYFAFLDLLDFKEIVKTKACSEIVDIFDEAKRHYMINEIDNNVEISVIPAVMSDSVCIYKR